MNGLISLVALVVASGQHQVDGSSIAEPLPRAPALAQASGERIPLPDAIRFPNGVAALSDGTILVGGITTGRVMRLSRRGWSEFFAGSPDVHAVTALRLDAERGVVWGASPDVLAVIGAGAGKPRRHRVFALEAATGVLIRSAAMPAGAFANDLALDGKGGVYVTDSLGGRVWRLPAGSDEFELVVEDARFRRGALGPAGIVRTAKGDLLVGLFSAGELFRVNQPETDPAVQRIGLERPISRLDGLALAPDGRLLAIEGGRGALLSINPENGMVMTLTTGLSGPVNLTISQGSIWISESGINDPASFDPTKLPPGGFSLRRIPLPPV